MELADRELAPVIEDFRKRFAAMSVRLGEGRTAFVTYRIDQ
jgi:hypothetical protein